MIPVADFNEELAGSLVMWQNGDNEDDKRKWLGFVTKISVNIFGENVAHIDWFYPKQYNDDVYIVSETRNIFVTDEI